ncbi:tetratricopeptide repeat protein [Streptomyces sp. NPDC093982]|uniref:tetratricopeptide repeat protein n=1 Tax=Streptomyces sp. NPDC093982 TaxID=3155077 RepID=UPI00343D96B1
MPLKPNDDCARQPRGDDPDGCGNYDVLLRDRGRLTEAENWFRRAAEAENTHGAILLGPLVRDRDELAEADRLFRGAAEAGDADAANNLGHLLAERGDLDEAETWFHRSATSGNPVGAQNPQTLRTNRKRRSRQRR